MGHANSNARAFSLMCLCVAMLFAGPVRAADGKAGKEDDGVEWTPIFELVANAPAVAGATYVGDKKFTTKERALRFRVKMTAAQGNSGSLTLTLYKEDRPKRKTIVAKLRRPEEKNFAIPIEPGEYRLEVSFNNVNVNIGVDTGKPK